jgi:hypothetical protein
MIGKMGCAEALGPLHAMFETGPQGCSSGPDPCCEASSPPGCDQYIDDSNRVRRAAWIRQRLPGGRNCLVCVIVIARQAVCRSRLRVLDLDKDEGLREKSLGTGYWNVAWRLPGS